MHCGERHLPLLVRPQYYQTSSLPVISSNQNYLLNTQFPYTVTLGVKTEENLLEEATI
jgi:hypothetical protein